MTKNLRGGGQVRPGVAHSAGTSTRLRQIRSDIWNDVLAVIGAVFRLDAIRWLLSIAALCFAAWGIVATVLPEIAVSSSSNSRPSFGNPDLFIISASIFFIYVLGTRVSRTRSLYHPTEPFPPIALSDVETVFNDMSEDSESAAAFYYIRLACQPNSRFERISESVSSLTRSTLVRTTYTLAISDNLAPGTTIVVPLMMQKKGSLFHGLKFTTSSEERISSLTQRATFIYAAAVIRHFIHQTSSRALAVYISDIESDVLQIITSTDVVSRDYDKAIQGVEDKILKVPGVGIEDVEILKMIVALLARLRKRFMICIPLTVPERSTTRSGSNCIRIISERRIVSTIIEHDPDLSTKGWWERTWARIRYLGRHTVDGLRLTLGVKPAVIQFSLENADRAGSYHIEIKGPEGTYLAAQEIRKYQPEGGQHNSQQVVFQPRLGQRHSHLYIREGSNFVNYVFLNRFYERTPGSMAAATVAAFASTVVIWACASVELGFVRADLGRTDIIAILLALPAVMAVWTGLERQGSVKGGVLAARISNLITMLISLSAAVIYLINPSGVERMFLWSLFALLIAINLIGSFGSWQLRSWTNRYFMQRTPRAERGLREEIGFVVDRDA